MISNFNKYMSDTNSKPTFAPKITPKMTNQQIIEKVAAGELSSEEATKLIANNNTDTKKVHYKVSQKGAISFYGLRRMPITLYIEELEKIVSLTCENDSWSEDFSLFLETEGNNVTRKS